ncbi:hypothetical protein QRQ56_07500 [Bradyrhizobium sp. U531]|uniref:hypothetical protein n=1 Tax=Bradyrhizobium sp. U531 TaxID=3053458 RepID=UPI003F429E34
MSFVSSTCSFELREFVARYVGLKPAVGCCAGSDKLASRIGFQRAERVGIRNAIPAHDKKHRLPTIVDRMTLSGLQQCNQ